MGEVAAAAVFGRCERRLPAIFDGFAAHATHNREISSKLREWKEGTAMEKIGMVTTRAKRSGWRMIVTAATRSPNDDIVTFSSNVSTDLPLYETPGVSFDDYLTDRPRIFRAMFPDQRRSKRLNEEEWMIQMLPIQFLLASVTPTVIMRLRCKSHGQGYPPLVSIHVPRILELQATRWELKGLDAVHMPSRFDLSVQGLLYSEPKRGGRLPRLKGHLEMSITMVLPPVLALFPEEVIRVVAESVLKRLVENMKKEVNEGLLSDFRNFGRERILEHRVVAPASAPASAAPDRRRDDPTTHKPQS